jgi:hypothetical protein
MALPATQGDEDVVREHAWWRGHSCLPYRRLCRHMASLSPQFRRVFSPSSGERELIDGARRPNM